ncbi:Terminase small subunit OS=Streptomyces microflavus OX=1919 GN=Smic_81370 PE=4 SV=1 [Streptomyces microflavus]
MTLAWWNEWRTSPQAQTFTGTDWSFLVDTALMHHSMWDKGQWTLAAEVRLRAAKFGATPEDRARLKLKVDEPTAAPQRPTQAPAGNVTDITSRKARLTG